ncbi:hypothetical protein CHARACLAT_021357 [Characodon lateralis]|uniref:Uncharacterized protein n=1 Tax=Characodon lateralis TaxID=208331 RepID=A0ABU7CQ77_9TELE|nr:hypothetical protein [Characodon lateralis]
MLLPVFMGPAQIFLKNMMLNVSVACWKKALYYQDKVGISVKSVAVDVKPVMNGCVSALYLFSEYSIRESILKVSDSLLFSRCVGVGVCFLATTGDVSLIPNMSLQ